MEHRFIVTSLHHRPWGAGDDHATVGILSTEKEAEDAAYNDFLQRCERYANGWESEWRRRPGDITRQLCGYCEDGEEDSEKYTASIKRVLQKREVTVQPRVLSTAQPKPGVVKPRHAYLVKEEQRMNVGGNDPRGFYDNWANSKLWRHMGYMLIWTLRTILLVGSTTALLRILITPQTLLPTL